MSGKKKQKKKQATSRRTAKQTAQKPKTQTSKASSKQEPKQSSRASSKQEPKRTSRSSSKPNTPKTSNNQTSKADNKTTSKQDTKQSSKASSKPNTPKTSNNQTSKANNKTTSKQEAKQETKQEKQSDKDKSAEQVEETKQASADIEVVIKKHNDSNNGHPHVILEDFEGDKHVSVGLTTRKYKGTNSSRKNYRLEKDPLDEVEESYMRRQGTVDYQKNYFEPRKGKLTKKDYERALLYGQKAKEKYIKKQQEKKKT